MNIRILKGYVLVLASGLALLAAGLLLILQWGNKADLTAYGPHVEVSTLLLMVASGVGGVLAALLARVLLHGMRSLSQGRREQTRRQAENRLAEMSSRPEAGPQDGQG